ncbi:MAG: DUF2231 domain-containing protein [Gemmatimonadaceae bacterium]
MLSKARIGTHPIHPMLIPFPLALWTGAVLFDAVAKYTAGHWHLHIVAYDMILLGCVGAVIAAIPGFIDLFGATEPGSRARSIGWTHALLNLTALAVFATGAYSRHLRHGTPSVTGYITDIIGVLIIGFSGWLGGALVYEHRVAIPDAGD